MNPSLSPPSPNLLDEALGLGRGGRVPWRVALVQDCVETSGAFLLHHFLKHALSGVGGGAVVFVALAQPFSHYDRVLRKMGCNLSLQRSKNKLHFIDLLNLELPGETCQNSVEDGFMTVYNRILRCIEANCLSDQKGGQISIIIDDVSLLEIIARGSVNHVLDFILYCVNITSDTDCSLVILSHEDIYSTENDPGLLSYLQYLSDVVIKTETLATGIAADVHGQLTIINKGDTNEYGRSMNKAHNFRFKVKENGVEIFYAGSQF